MMALSETAKAIRMLAKAGVQVDRNKVSSDHLADLFCSTFGHAKIVSLCFGYIHCERCGDQIGDRLGGVFNISNYVIKDHNCDKCQANFAKLKPIDRLLCPDPFNNENRE